MHNNRDRNYHCKENNLEERKLLINSMQAAIFCSELLISNKEEFIYHVVQETNDFLKGEPTILPIPDDAPPEIPRIILKSKTYPYSCNFCKNRFDFFYKEQRKPDKTLEQVFPDFQKILDRLTAYVKTSLNIKVMRLGFISNFVIGLKESGNKYLLREYLHPNIFLNPYEIQINVLHKFELGFFKVNRWIKLKPLRMKNNVKDDRRILIEIDINTLSEETYDFSPDQIKQFIVFARNHIRDEVMSSLK